jgi:hypothetical protein
MYMGETVSALQSAMKKLKAQVDEQAAAAATAAALHVQHLQEQLQTQAAEHRKEHLVALARALEEQRVHMDHQHQQGLQVQITEVQDVVSLEDGKGKGKGKNGSEHY